MKRHTRRRVLSSVGLLSALILVVATGTLLYRWYDTDNALQALSRGQYSQAVDFLREPAADGKVAAQLILANLHYLGLGVKRDLSTARELYEKAARRGNASAQYNLALFHMNGLSIPVDNVAAVAWFLLADDGGSPGAETHLRSLSGMLNPNSIQTAEALKKSLHREIESNTTNN